MGFLGSDWGELLGWVPAIVFPTASMVQLLIMIRSRSGQGVSAITWSLFAFANICLFLYIDKRGDLQAFATTLGTAAIQIAIVVLALKWRKPSPTR